MIKTLTKVIKDFVTRGVTYGSSIRVFLISSHNVTPAMSSIVCYVYPHSILWIW
jgi:hypothetical protein